jgi:type I restriction enzyme S subunit
MKLDKIKSEKDANRWQTKTLRDLATINYGQSPAGILSDDGPYPVVGTGGSDRRGKDYLHEGDSIILGRKGTIDRVYFATGRFWTIDTAYYLNNFTESVPLWLYYFLQSIDLRQMNEATGVPSLSRDLLYKIEIPTPPIPEQSKIAEILSTVDRAIEQTEALIAKQQRIKTGLMQDLLTRGIDEHGNLRSEQTHQFKDSPLGRIPVEWEVKKLEECVEFWDRKRVPLKQDDRDLMEGDIPYYGASGIIDYIDRFLFDDDLILVGEDGENVVSRHLPLAFKVSGKVWVNNHAHVLNPLSAVKIDFLTDRLEFYDYTLIVSGSAQPKLNQHNLRNMLLPIPKIEEQNQIAQTLIAVKSELGDLSKKLNKFRSLKTALMQDLLTGKKRVTTLLKVVSLAE